MFTEIEECRLNIFKTQEGVNKGFRLLLPLIHILKCGGGEGGGSPGEKGWEAGEGRVGSRIPKVAGTGRKQVKFCNVSLYFAIDMGQRGVHHYGKGREAGVSGTAVQEAGGADPPVPTH